jgi:hypothetical protein
MTTSTPDPGTAQVRGAVISGSRAELIQVQATVGTGPPSYTVTRNLPPVRLPGCCTHAAQPAC